MIFEIHANCMTNVNIYVLIKYVKEKKRVYKLRNSISYKRIRTHVEELIDRNPKILLVHYLL
ncbi:hypothetical protein B6F84_12895 [Acidianus manzaensis]|uniref:Uncharacterized protein n=1 Tax=Acidianus manzaensis TaxID=282676 RepID=A0A1W6K2W5_9CREN|nr:hypothetical protein B6F84_12895 [Acidianus manzaensis]